MKHLLFTFTFLVVQLVNAQEIVNGVIMPTEEFEGCCVYIPNSGLTVYEKANGPEIGRLVLGEQDNNREVYSAFLEVNGERIKFAYPNLHMVGYEVMAMVYVDNKGEFVKTNNGYWLKTEELRSKGLILTSWMDYLINKEDVLGWYANDPGLNLRTEPSVKSEILATLKGNLWEITPTKETSGLWCKVFVKEYRKHPCSGEEDLVIRTLEGWVKLLSDEQTPNVWNYGKGC